MKIRMKFNRRMSAGEVRAFEERKAAKERGESVEKRTVKRREYEKPQEEYDIKEPSEAAGRREWPGQDRRPGRKERTDSSGKYSWGEKPGRREKEDRGEGMGRRDRSGRGEGMDRVNKLGRGGKSGRGEDLNRGSRSGREDSMARGSRSGREADLNNGSRTSREESMGRGGKPGRRGTGAGKVKELWNTGHILAKRQKSEPEYDEYAKADEAENSWEESDSMREKGSGQAGYARAGRNSARAEEKAQTDLSPKADAAGQETEGIGMGYEPDASLPKIEGRNAVLEAFRAGKTIDKLFVLEGCKDGPVQTILREAKKHDTIINFVDKERLVRMSGTKKHQGVIAVTAAYEYASVDDILQKAEEAGEQPFLILLDSIEDPHNLGAIIRTANLAGAHGVIIPKRRAVGLTGAVAKASAGAINYTPVAKVTNLNQTIKELKERGIWFVCADMEGEQMYRQNLTGPIGLVIGAEGAGVSRLVKENCDFTASIPMKGEIGSLNASTAAAVLSYEIVRQRQFADN